MQNPEPQTISISLSTDKIYTNSTGLNQIQRFYQTALAYSNTTINIDVSQMTWIDGNMSALVGAALYQLNSTNNLSFTISFNDVEKRFSILFQNGLIKTDNVEFKRKKLSTAIPFKAFFPYDKDGFINYVVDELLIHNGMPKFGEAAKDKLLDDLAELCCNINLHSETDKPFFVCGQHFPKSRKVIFTVTDLGGGFLPKIRHKTNGKIECSKEAILWAVKGNSSKLDAPGGIHLSKMLEFFTNHEGHLHIISGDAYYNTENVGTILRPDGVTFSDQQFMGSTVHLVFNQNSLAV